MIGFELYVVFIAATSSITDATVTWDSPVTTVDEESSLTITIREGTTVFDSPSTLSATTDVPNADITYFIWSGASDEISINEQNGTLTLSNALDYEFATSYILTIMAVEVLPESGQSVAFPTTATATVTINVEDVPTFAKDSGQVCVKDGASAGDVVATLPVTDTFDSATYLITGNGNADFKINGEKVVVADQKTLNKNVNSYTLTITADNAPETPTMTLAVQIGDCSAASLLAPLGLLTILVALIQYCNLLN